MAFNREPACPEDVERVEDRVFLANLDYYLNAVEAGQKVWLTREDEAICSLLPIED